MHKLQLKNDDEDEKEYNICNVRDRSFEQLPHLQSV